MPVFVKICGLARPADLKAAAACEPDAVGFVFWPGSPRAVTADAVRHWTRDLDPGILRVGVFVDATPDEAGRIREEAGLDVVQWHGPVSADAARALGGLFWRVVTPAGVPDEPDWIAAGLDAWVVDTPGGAMPGGTGRLGDWEAAAAWVRRARRPVVLAGGLTPENVAEAVERVRPWGVDVSSGVEQAPGRKDPERIREFIERCRNA